jgi:pyrimidine operon attenuation protein/uracil phosphoribosyltransferase
MGKDLENKLRKIIREELYRALDEGIDFDPQTKTVSYNPTHENNVDTSIENNPSYNKELVSGVQVWSVFKRKRGLRGDGNPLIYALKGEGWAFRSEEDRLAIERQFDAIATKFAKAYPIGVTILMPSSNELNNHIAEVIMSKSKNAELIKGVICKMTTEEIDKIVLDDNSKFRQIYKDNFNSAYFQLGKYLDEMDEQKGGIFLRHMVRDSKMRDALDKTLKVSDDKYAEFANKINGQDILIIDDTISRGQTIAEACQIMRDSYSPKSITVLTLLSSL